MCGGGYKIYTLGDVCQSYIGLTYKPEHINDSGVLVLRSSNIQNAKLDFNDQVRVNGKIAEKYFVQKGDVLVCVRNGSKKLLGKSAYIENISEPMSFGAFMAICRSELGKWIYLWMQTEHYFEQVEKVAGTVSINQLTQKTLLSFQIPVPVIAEEREKIITEIEAIEQKIAQLESEMAQADTKKKAILAEYL